MWSVFIKNICKGSGDSSGATCSWTGFYSDGDLLWEYLAGEALVVSRSIFGPRCIGWIGSPRTKGVLPCEQVIFNFKYYMHRVCSAWIIMPVIWMSWYLFIYFLWLNYSIWPIKGLYLLSRWRICEKIKNKRAKIPKVVLNRRDFFIWRRSPEKVLIEKVCISNRFTDERNNIIVYA